MTDIKLVAQGLGFMHQYLEILKDENRAGADQAVEWFNIIDAAFAEYRMRALKAEQKLAELRANLG